MKIGTLIVSLLSAAFYIGGYLIAGWLGVLGALLLWWGFTEYVLGPLIAVLLRRFGLLEEVAQRTADESRESLHRWDVRGRFISGKDQ